MKAMILNEITHLVDNPTPLVLTDIEIPEPKPGQVLIQVSVCGVCHTELDEIEGRTPPPQLPVIPGHQVVGRIVGLGEGSSSHKLGDRVGVAWIFSSCGFCIFCQSGQENFCPEFQATGRDAHGGYAEYMVAGEGYVYPIPEVFSDSQAAPLLCAGAIGYRSLKLTNLEDGQDIGLTGFGASGHLVMKLVKHTHPKSRVFVFARSESEREFARSLGAAWAGDTTDRCPRRMHAIIDTTPAWVPVVEALKNLQPGGRLVINAIRKEDQDKDVLLSLNYPEHLWMEKEIKSVANITRTDVDEFLQIAAEIPLKPEYQEFALEQANQALNELKGSKIRGAKVLRMGS